MAEIKQVADKQLAEEDMWFVEKLPPCFRFAPTNSEIILFLALMVFTPSFSHNVILQSNDVYTIEPWLLPQISDRTEDKYFYVKRNKELDKKTIRKLSQGGGWWKDTCLDKKVLDDQRNNLIGLKKTLGFFRFREGSPRRGIRTLWTMHEYTLFSYHGNKGEEEWALCRITKQAGHYTRSGAATLVYQELS